MGLCDQNVIVSNFISRDIIITTVTTTNNINVPNILDIGYLVKDLLLCGFQLQSLLFSTCRPEDRLEVLAFR